MVKATSRPLYPRGNIRYQLYRRLGGPQGRSGRVRKISPPAGIRSPDRPAHSQSLYRLRYPGNHTGVQLLPICNPELEGAGGSVRRHGHFNPEKKNCYPLYRRLGGPQGRSGRAENLAPTGIRSTDRPACRESLYRLSYLGPTCSYKTVEKM